MHFLQAFTIATFLSSLTITVRSLQKDQQPVVARQQTLKSDQTEMRPEALNYPGTSGENSKPALRDRIRVTITDSRTSLSRIENLNSLMDQMSIAILKPITIINVLREFILSITSLIMSASAVSNSRTLNSRNRSKDWKTRYSLIPHHATRLSRSTGYL